MIMVPTSTEGDPLATAKIIHGACLDVLPSLPDNSVDAVVTDPPYGLSNATPEKITEAITRWAAGDRDFLPEVAGGFMGKAWDSFVPPVAVWDDCMRVLKPGGHMVVFAGSRTFDLMALAIRLAGFEIRDSLAWLYGSGFPKSLDVSKAIDKFDATDERRARALRFTAWMRSTGITSRQIDEVTGTRMGGHYLTAESQPAVATVAHLDALRPLLPPVPEWVEEMARQRTVESQAFASREVLGTRKGAQSETTGRYGAWGNDDGSGRSEFSDTAPATDAARQWEGWGTALKPAFEPVVLARKPLVGTVAANVQEHGTGALNIDGCRVEGAPRTTHAGGNRVGNRGGASSYTVGQEGATYEGAAGRWPANVILDESQAAALDQQSGESVSKAGGSSGTHFSAGGPGVPTPDRPRGGHNDSGGASRFFYVAKAPKKERPVVDGIAHPTVKPLALMRWLVRLVTPPGGTVLEPFAGSGTTVEAALLEGFDVVGVEREADYLPLIQARIDRAQDAVTSEPEQPNLFAS